MTSIDEKLQKLMEEADFGDLVEVTLTNKEYVAVHDNDGIGIYEPKEGVPGQEYAEWGIFYVVGYYGGIKNRNAGAVQTTGIFDGKIGHGLLLPEGHDNVENKVLCLDPTLHKKDALRNLKFAGEGNHSVV